MEAKASGDGGAAEQSKGAGGDAKGRAGGGGKKTVLFDISKKELMHPNSGFKKMFRRLRSSYRVSLNRDELDLEKLREASLVIFGGPRQPFSEAEMEALKQYLEGGGSAAFFLSEGGDARLGTNANDFLKSYGMQAMADAVVRTSYFKYHHPKEALITHGILHEDIALQKDSVGARGGKGAAPSAGGSDASAHGGLSFVYPYGASMAVQRPACSVLSSGPLSYPLDRPVAGAWEHPSGGRLLAVGSCEVFGDEWVDKEENGKLWAVLSKWLLREVALALRPREAEVLEYTYVPDTQSLAAQLKACLQETEALPLDFTSMFKGQLFGFHTGVIPEVVRLYDALNVRHEPLSLIPPQFECPLPLLQPATVPPILKEPPPPALDQFDLDEHFASKELRMAQLTNKCSGMTDKGGELGEKCSGADADDLDYYIVEAGEVLGITAELPEARRGPKNVLDFIFRQIVQWKKTNPEDFGPSGPPERASAAPQGRAEAKAPAQARGAMSSTGSAGWHGSNAGGALEAKGAAEAKGGAENYEGASVGYGYKGAKDADHKAGAEVMTF